MVLVDTSVWVEFLRKGNDLLLDLLVEQRVAVHPLIIGELSVGNVAGRDEFLKLLGNLPQVVEASHEEVYQLIENHRLWGKGVGFFDLHILSSSLLCDMPLWTLDKRLAEIAGSLKLSL